MSERPVVCVFLCWSRLCVVQKRMNRSRCRLWKVGRLAFFWTKKPCRLLDGMFTGATRRIRWNDICGGGGIAIICYTTAATICRENFARFRRFPKICENVYTRVSPPLPPPKKNNLLYTTESFRRLNPRILKYTHA